VLGPEQKRRTGFAMPPLRYPDGKFYLKCATASSVNTPLTDESVDAWFRGKGLASDAAEIVAMRAR
jgi:hypothetical protein